MEALMEILVRSMVSEMQMSIEDARVLYKTVIYQSVKPLVCKKIVLALLKEHPVDVEYTTEMTSWFIDLLNHPLVCKEEIDGVDSEMKSGLQHILYYYPKLGPFFRANYNLNTVVTRKHLTEKIKADFPDVFVEYNPTVAEQVCYYSGDDNRYDVLKHRVNTHELDLYYANQLLSMPYDVRHTTETLTLVLNTLKQVRDSGITIEKFHYFIKKNWKNHIFIKILDSFYTQRWNIKDMMIIAEILSMYPKYEKISNMIKKHGNYARLFISSHLMTYLLNLPFNVFLPKDVLFEKLDHALSNPYEHEKKVIEYNKRRAQMIIDQVGIPIKNDVPESYYSYNTTELSFSIRDEKLECMSRQDMKKFTLNDRPGDYLHLKVADTISVVKNNDIDKVNLNLISLFDYYSRPEYHKATMDALLNSS